MTGDGGWSPRTEGPEAGDATATARRDGFDGFGGRGEMSESRDCAGSNWYVCLRRRESSAAAAKTRHEYAEEGLGAEAGRRWEYGLGRRAATAAAAATGKSTRLGLVDYQKRRLAGPADRLICTDRFSRSGANKERIVWCRHWFEVARAHTGEHAADASAGPWQRGVVTMHLDTKRRRRRCGPAIPMSGDIYIYIYGYVYSYIDMYICNVQSVSPYIFIITTREQAPSGRQDRLAPVSSGLN